MVEILYRSFLHVVSCWIDNKCAPGNSGRDVGLIPIQHVIRWPSNNQTLGQRKWFGPALYKWYTNVLCLLGQCPTHTKHWTNVGLMLAQRLRRWPNIKPTLVYWLMFAGWWWFDAGRYSLFFFQMSLRLTRSTSERSRTGKTRLIL